ncbi:GPP34 family phosphoprotein [Actinoplanes sp. NPDC051861]|uniref:GOLPH3/VPS74 family protein n=1 Tax=Actinoplanes sp. NPDC051861 TaxID=3155170 RepID=UPI0034206162
MTLSPGGLPMSSVEPGRLADGFWLAAHDSVGVKPRIVGWPLGIGLAAGLLAESIEGGFLEVRGGELFRTTARFPEDPALRAVLQAMAREERDWSSLPPLLESTLARGPVPGRARNGTGMVRRGCSGRRRGHDLDSWLSYLAYARRAEDRVVERLSRDGLVRREESHRLFGRSRVRYRPLDSAVAGQPASAVTVAVRRGDQLDRACLLLAGLMAATGLHEHALATLTSADRAALNGQLKNGLDGMLWALILAAEASVGEGAMR